MSFITENSSMLTTQSLWPVHSWLSLHSHTVAILFHLQPPHPLCLVMLIRKVTYQEFLGATVQEFVPYLCITGAPFNVPVLCWLAKGCLIVINQLLITKSFFSLIIWLCYSHADEHYLEKFPSPVHHSTRIIHTWGNSESKCTHSAFLNLNEPELLRENTHRKGENMQTQYRVTESWTQKLPASIPLLSLSKINNGDNSTSESFICIHAQY